MVFVSEGQPPEPHRREAAVPRLIVGLFALALAVGVFAVTSALALGWRILLAVLVAAPLLLLVDLLRDRSGPPPGFRPRRWEDEDEGKRPRDAAAEKPNQRSEDV